MLETLRAGVPMSSKEQIRAAIENASQEELDELNRLIRQYFASKKAAAAEPDIWTKLQDVRIDAPPDFSVNLDLYKSGEKRVEDEIR
jgi:hypothetical protein